MQFGELSDGYGKVTIGTVANAYDCFEVLAQHIVTVNFIGGGLSSSRS
jgi:hypothetical protein